MAGRELWGFEGLGRLGRVMARAAARMRRGGNKEGEFVRSRGFAGLARPRRSERMCGPCEGNTFLLRRAGEGEEMALRGGKRRDDPHELSILIRFGDGERAGRGPPNVSTMII